VATAVDLDLPTAWNRIKADRPDRAFTTHPCMFEVIETDLKGWFDTIRSRLDSGFYPAESVVYDVPKPNWLVRPAHVVTLEDELVYTAVLGAFHESIWEKVKWSQGTVDIGYRLAPPSKLTTWVRRDFTVWEEWRVKSLAAVTDDVFFVLTTDITGFYENIDHQRLASDLKALGVPAVLLTGLMKYIGRWIGPRGKGIPQGYSASDILAKLYMDPVDRGMKNAGFHHLRYVDDIRVFCRTKLEAKHALLKLNELVRNRGLNLQSSKTRILKTEEAKREIDGVAPQLRSISAQIAKEIKEMGAAGVVYGTLHDLEKFLARNPDAPPPEILERAFSENFLGLDATFDKTLFHYLLSRLGRVQSKIAVDYCLRQISIRPEETKYVLRYLSRLPSEPATDETLLDYMASSEAIYDYQLYELVRWFYGARAYPERLLRLCRQWATDMNRSPCLRAYCRAILGDAASSDDLDLLEAECAQATTITEKVEFIVSLAKMEAGRRNAMMGRYKGDGFLIQKAIEYAKKLSSQATTADGPDGHRVESPELVD
jgi:hypothetical protein